MSNDETKTKMTVGKLLEIIVICVLLVMTFTFAAISIKESSKANELAKENEQLRAQVADYKSKAEEVSKIVNSAKE